MNRDYKVSGRKSYQREKSHDKSKKKSSSTSESSSPEKSNNLSSSQESLNDNNYYKSEKPKYSNESFGQNKSTTQNKSWTVGIIAVVFLVFICLRLFASNNIAVEKKVCSFVDIGHQYPDQNTNIFKSLQIEIDGIVNIESEELAVFLFLHNNSTFTNALIEAILEETAVCLNATQETDILHLTKEDFTSEKATEDYGHVIEKYKQNMKNVLFVVNLNQIPGMTARALHSICDTHTPIKSRVVIFLTLITNQHKVDNPTAVAYNTLFDLWESQVERHELDALITRVTDHVVFLKDPTII